MRSAMKTLRSHFALVSALALSVVLGAQLFTCRAQAQSADLAAKIATNLKPEAQSVIARLSALSKLPDGTWKMHSGDLAHGEAPKLDESSWQPVAPGNQAPNDAVWFRQTYTVLKRSAATI